MGTGEIARCKQFILYPRCLQKNCTADMFKQGLVWERVMTCVIWEGGGALIFFISQDYNVSNIHEEDQA